MATPKDKAIAFMNATTAAATLLSAHKGTVEDLRKVRDALFADIQPLLDAMPDTESRGGGGGFQKQKYGEGKYEGDPADYTLGSWSKAHSGKTMQQVYAEAPGYVTWLAEKSRNQEAKDVAQRFLASL